MKTKALMVLALAALLLGLTGCLFGPSALELERQALRHSKKALDHAQRLIPLLEVQSWAPAYKRAGKLRGELEQTSQSLDRAMKKWALKGRSPLRYELDALEILDDVAENNAYIQKSSPFRSKARMRSPPPSKAG